MTENIFQSNNQIMEIKCLIASSEEIIQSKLLNPNDLAKYSHSHGLSLLSKKYIVGLWNIGLLQADVIYSSEELNVDGLCEVHNTHNEDYVYYDNRMAHTNTKGWGGSLTEELETIEKLELYFHPYRFYVLYNLERILSYRITPVQYLLNPDGANRLIDWENESFDKLTGSEDFIKKIYAWNSIADLIVFIEPWAYSKVFNKVHWHYPDDVDTFNKKKLVRLSQITSHLEKLCLDDIEKVRQRLCIDMELLDENKILHILLRMMNSNIRDNLKGKIAGSMLVFTMAEMLRLACEETFNTKLKEEDELGFGVWMKGVKENMYGSGRLYDANRGVKNEFMRQYGLDYGIRARCYVEGETEAGALAGLLGISTGIEVINLKGRVSAKGVVAFRDSLKQDIESQVFSIVLIDNDRKDYVRAIKKAADDDEICGLFFISQPDFEFGNFELIELAEVIVAYAQSKDIHDLSVKGVNRNIQGSSSGKELMEKINQTMPEIKGISKGEEWGKALIDYAAQNPNYCSKDNVERPISEVVTILLRSLSVSYRTTRTKYRVSSETGKLVERSQV